MATEAPRRRWWLPPLLWGAVGLAAMAAAWLTSPTAREVLAKAVFMIVGAVSTPFILEASVAVAGLVIVLVINQWRMQRETDEWVYLAQTEVDPKQGETPPHRLDPVVLKSPPGAMDTLETRLSVIEGYVELGLAREALDQLESLSPEDRATEQALTLRAAAVARLG